MPNTAKTLLFAQTLIIGGSSCACVSPTPPPARPDAVAPNDATERLASMMVGSFSSAAQAKNDPENFRNITLHMVRVWADRPDGPWLYVEQATAEAPAKPYRQRVYRLVRLGDGSIRSDVYTLPGDPLGFAGSWQSPRPLAGLSPDQLTLREGCSILLLPQSDGTFKGATSGTGCASDLRGAKYAVSDALVTPDRLVSWDRGYDESGKQVWGATQGGYIFIKQ